jgi:hypothetical protein
MGHDRGTAYDSHRQGQHESIAHPALPCDDELRFAHEYWLQFGQVNRWATLVSMVNPAIRRILDVGNYGDGDSVDEPALPATSNASMCALGGVIDPPPLNWSTLRYVFGHEKEDRNAEKAPQA